MPSPVFKSRIRRGGAPNGCALSVWQIAEICNGRAEGDTSRQISGASALDSATESDLSFVANQKAAQAALRSQAGCLLVTDSFKESGAWSIVRVADPRVAFARAVQALYPPKQYPPFVHPTAIIAPSAKMSGDCFIDAYVTIGERSEIGSACYIGKGCTIGEQVTIGGNSALYPNVTIYDNVQIGARAVLHAGCVIGADGFGFTLVGDHYEKFPQIGTVEIGDDVEIGANSCVDRAALGTTKIGDGTKLDNLIHIAHNVTMGKHVVAAAQAGFSGSVTVGDYAVIGGQAGIADKAQIESKAVVGAKSGIVSSQRVPAGEPVWGMPGRPIKQHLRGLAHVAKLPEMREELKALQKRIEDLEATGGLSAQRSERNRRQR